MDDSPGWGKLSFRSSGYSVQAGKIEDDEGYEDRSLAYQQVLQLVLEAQREALLRMRSEGQLSNEEVCARIWSSVVLHSGDIGIET